jgi:hypothetical protein
MANRAENDKGKRGQVGFITLFVALTAAAPAALAAPNAAAPAPANANASPTKIGVAGIGAPTFPAELSAKLEAAAAAGLTASGASVVAPTAARCADATCRQKLADQTGARDWLRGNGRIDGSTYHLHLEIVDARTEAVLVARDDVCELCTEAEAAEATNIAASALKAALDRLPRPAAELPAAPALGSTSSRSSDQGGSRVEANRRPLWQRALPWVAIAVGAGAIGVGAYDLSRNGDGAACQSNDCVRTYDTGGRGGLWLGVGAALAATGVVVLTLSSRGHPGPEPASASAPPTPSLDAQVIASARGVTIVGTF